MAFQLYSLLVVCVVCLAAFARGAALLPDDEVEALREIGQTLGKTDWDFSVDPCSGVSGWKTNTTKGNENALTCNCTTNVNTSTVCHVTSIMLKAQSLPGVLPPELVKLPYLLEIDLTRNYLNGSIPKEWGSMQALVNISLQGNRLSGRIPVELANITTLKTLALEYNQFSGVLPPELGNWTSIERIMISSNNFTGPLPETLAKLTTLKDFRISDNNFSGKIPDFIQNWVHLDRIEIQASGLEGPIPLGVSLLTNLTDIRISDFTGISAAFPPISNMKKMRTLILRSCNITGEIPAYLGDMATLKTLDLSFNKLTGRIPSSLDSVVTLNFIFFAGNALTGPVPESITKHADIIDFSYNNFTLASSGLVICQQNNINLFGTSSLGNNSTGIVPCFRSFRCPKNSYYSLHINCGGRVTSVGSTTYEDDYDSGGASKFFQSRYNWAFSSTGSFLDNDIDQDSYIAINTSRLTMKDHQLYTTARLSPLSLTYYGFCLVNGNYTVKLHFAEITFTNDRNYSSLGRRIFDIYIQGKLVWKDFNINDEAGGVGKEVIKPFNAVVTGSTLEIRFYWSGKGTTGIPTRGTYGPLVSAISVNSNFKPPSKGKHISLGTVIGSVLSVLVIITVVLGVLWWKGCFEKHEISEGQIF